MEVERHKKRKCGPRVKTGCITCRIRRVKCDEDKPNCQRCVSTGRKCDGYVAQQKASPHRSQLRPNDGGMELVGRPQTALTPFDSVHDQRSRQLFHFYCVQSAFDLSVYLNSRFWHDMILQYSQHHSVVRQAVVAFGSSHMYALSMNQTRGVADANHNAVEQVRQYDVAIRSLREYMTSDQRPDPHVILICCALFFSCENARGNREAAWQHLENGLHILKSFESRRIKKSIKNETDVTGELELMAFKNGPKLKAKTDKLDIDEELVYVFSRLDVQATLCDETRKPVLNLSDIANPSITDSLTESSTFSTITEAQRSLDYLHNRLAHFLSVAATERPQDLNSLCANWETSMYAFINNQKPAVIQNLRSRHAPKPANSPEWQLALQIQLLTLHHRCWWMLFRSYHNPSTYTMSPNRRAEEILDVCDFLGFALPLRPSVVSGMTEMDIAWKMISEISVTAPLYVLGTKCTDPTIRSRALKQLFALRNHGNGMYHESFLDEVIKVVEHTNPAKNVGNVIVPKTALDRILQQSNTPNSDYDYKHDGPSYDHAVALEEVPEHEHEHATGTLMGWSRASPPL